MNNAFLERKGYRPERRFYAHGQGYDFVKRPFIRYDEPMKIKAGMNLTLHPGAKIGERFFIDHATGVVVGETAVVGNNVKFYQGVSLVAISIPKDAQTIQGVKRHPTLEDDVTIYAEATILGNVTIGKGSVIGANAWVRRSVPPGVTVMMAVPETRIKHHNDDESGKDQK